MITILLYNKQPWQQISRKYENIGNSKDLIVFMGRGRRGKGMRMEDKARQL